MPPAPLRNGAIEFEEIMNKIDDEKNYVDEFIV
jgi:hypothetical protein